jgi:DNA helicase-2/ATP-dependent DNA helicase PcrA
MSLAYAGVPHSLNAAQREAVAHDDGPMLVIAGAGSGKTRVLTSRIARLVRERDVPPDRILAVTFTNKAAAEMRERISALLAADPRGLWIGTFHAIGARMLRRHAPLVGRTSAFTIYDADDTEALVRRLMDESGIAATQWAPRAIAATISSAQNALVSASEYAAGARDAFTQAVAAVYGRLEPALARANAVTFDGLLTLPASLLSERTEIAAQWQRRFHYVLVDEYQDTNHAQYQFVRQVAAHGNLFVVGDDDQSIYGWRGADIRNILEFERDFPSARIVRLEENYRSRPAILALANAVIEENQGRRGKILRATRDPGAPVMLVSATDDRDEAEFVADQVQIIRSEIPSLSLGDFAVLYRTNAQSRPLEEQFQRRGIPYRLVGQVRFYERREVKDILAWLRLIANPHDDEAFRRAIAAPRRGVGDGTLDVLSAVAAASGASLLTAARDADALSIRGATRLALREFVDIIDRFHSRAAEPRVDLLIADLVEATGFSDWLAREGPDAADRVANVESLIQGAAEPDEFAPEDDDTPLPPLLRFLQRVALVTSADETETTEGAVTLMTLHNAKGLEFPVVFITGLEDGLLPLLRATEGDDALEEERRLLYVGITRARELLLLTHTRRRWRNGEAMPAIPSRFVRDLPPGLVTAHGTLRARATPRFEARWEDGSDDAPLRTRFARRRGEPVEWESSARHLAVENESQDAPAFAVGERVHHASFGDGTIVDLSGHGRLAKARIDFDDESIGRKTLMLAQANLERGWV